MPKYKHGSGSRLPAGQDMVAQLLHQRQTDLGIGQDEGQGRSQTDPTGEARPARRRALCRASSGTSHL